MLLKRTVLAFASMVAMLVPTYAVSDSGLKAVTAGANVETVKAQIKAFTDSLSAGQRAQIKAVLDANKPAKKSLTPGVKPSLQQLQAEGAQTDAWIKQVNAGIEAVLNQSQVSAFRASLPEGRKVQQFTGSGYCYDAWYYEYYYVYEYYAYYAYYYAYYHNLYYGAAGYGPGYDTAALDALSTAINAWNNSFVAATYSYYAYAVSQSTYGHSAWEHTDYTTSISSAVSSLAYLGYYWYGDGYGYDAYVYAYYADYYSGYNAAEYYAYYCAAGD